MQKYLSSLYMHTYSVFFSLSRRMLRLLNSAGSSRKRQIVRVGASSEQQNFKIYKDDIVSKMIRYLLWQILVFLQMHNHIVPYEELACH